MKRGHVTSEWPWTERDNDTAEFWQKKYNADFQSSYRRVEINRQAHTLVRTDTILLNKFMRQRWCVEGCWNSWGWWKQDKSALSWVVPFSEDAAHRDQFLPIFSVGLVPSRALPKSDQAQISWALSKPDRSKKREQNIRSTRGKPFLHFTMAGVILHIHFTNPACTLCITKKRRQTLTLPRRACHSHPQKSRFRFTDAQKIKPKQNRRFARRRWTKLAKPWRRSSPNTCTTAGPQQSFSCKPWHWKVTFRSKEWVREQVNDGVREEERGLNTDCAEERWNAETRNEMQCKSYTKPSQPRSLKTRQNALSTFRYITPITLPFKSQYNPPSINVTPISVNPLQQ